MKIKKIDLKGLRNDEHFQFMAEFRDLAAADSAVKNRVGALLPAFLSLYAREDEALQRIVKSDLTRKIHDADKARDKVFTMMLDLIKAMCKHFNPVIADAAMRIKIVFDTYGNIAKKPLNEQTSAIYNLLQELDKPEYTDDRINIQINPFLNELKNCNERLEGFVKQRYEEGGSKSDIVLKDARKEVDEQYKTIAEFLNSHFFIDGIVNPAGLTEFEHFVKTFNKVVEKYISQMHARAHHKHHSALDVSEAEDENDE